MKRLNLILIFVFAFSFVITGCQKPAAPKAKTSDKAASAAKSVSKPIVEVSHVAPEPAASVNQTVQKPVEPVNPSSQKPVALASQAIQHPVEPVNPTLQKPLVPASQAIQQPTGPVNGSPHKLVVSVSQAIQQPTASVSQTVQKPIASVTKTAGKSAGAKIFTGKVDSVSAGNEKSGTSSHILVVDDKGQLWIFTVKSSTPITAADGTALVMDKIKKDNKVNIEYKSVNNEINEFLVIHEAQSIELAE